MDLPDYDHLPVVKDVSMKCAWGLFDEDNKKDRLGTINLLTPDVVAAAASEIKTGKSISLNWPIGSLKPKAMGFGRKSLTHKHITRRHLTGTVSMDDELSFNTQCGSQWDSLCHYAHQGSGLYYNGTKHDDVFEHYENDTNPTLDSWHTRGGVVGRGVLLDYKAYADAKGIAYDPTDRHVISISDLESVAAHEGVKFRHGDILIVRSGLIFILGSTSEEEQAFLQGKHTYAGIEGTENAARWLWNHHFAAVAGDMLAFEAYPPDEEHGKNLVLHQYLLSLFGMSIGELWDLEALSKYCSESGRWTFFFTSCPLNVAAGIASPPNALAIF